jgi:hypothetical protein
LVGVDLVSGRFWKLKVEDDIKEYVDIRRKVGNRIIRAYLLENAFNGTHIDRMDAILRGPKGEFNDFSKFLIVRTLLKDEEVEILVESGVYENLRIVGTDSNVVAELSAEEIIKALTDALIEITPHKTTIVISNDSTVSPK